MLRIGYISLPDRYGAADPAAAMATLTDLGCGVVRVEEPSFPGGEPLPVLRSVLESIGEGDQLVVARLEHLGAGGRAILGVLERLERRGASLHVLHPEISSRGPGAAALHAALEAVAALEPAGLPRARPAAALQDIRALQRSGVGPVEIARRLGVSRMTVWRKLKAMQPCGA